MGNKIMSLMGRPFRNYNIESRAHKIISQEKPTPAPKYKADEQTLNDAMKQHANVYEESLKKNENLDKHLKEVFVRSHDAAGPIAASATRPLPLDRNAVEGFIYGIQAPDKVPPGKVVLKDALKFITDHTQDAKTHSSQAIAEEYKIPEDTIKNVLKHYKVYEMYIPQQRKTKAKFAGPSVPRIKVVSHPLKRLEPDSKEAPKVGQEK